MTKKKFWVFFVITQIFLLINEPYAINRFLSVPNLSVTGIGYLIILCLYVLSNKGKIKALPTKINHIFVITIIAWLLYGIFFDDTSYFTRIVLLCITYLFLLFLYSTECFGKFWKNNNRFILLQAFLSAIGFILVGLGILSPLLISESTGDVFQPMYFWGFCCSKTLIGNLIRPSGYFDEPGALASWAVFTIVFNYAFIKDRFIDKYLPYLTIVTLSIAYYIQMVVYLILRFNKRIYKFIPLAILLFFVLNYISSTKNTDFDIYSKTIARLEYDEDKGITGNSREDHMKNAQRLFESSPWFGVGGQNYGNSQEVVSDNPYEILAKDGIVGFIITYLPLFIIFFVNCRKEILICLVVISIGYLQRPFHINFMHDFYLWSFLLFSIIDKEKMNK